MKVFVTGATGFVGSAITRNLISHQHTVLGLVRSKESADKLVKAGATPVLGTLQDLPLLTQTAKECDAIIHTAYIHDFLSPTHDAAKNSEVDLDAMKAIVAGIKGTNKPFVATNGLMGGPTDRPIKENDVKAGRVRTAPEDYFREAARDGVKTITIRLAPSVHGDGDWGFIPILIKGAKRNGFAMLVDETKSWVGCHVDDAADLYRLAIEKDLAGGTVLHAVEDEIAPTKDIAELIATKTGLPVKNVSPDEAKDLFGFIGVAFAQDLWADKKKTVKLTGWQVKQVTLIEDMKKGRYF